jgi:hypothetical protein
LKHSDVSEMCTASNIREMLIRDKVRTSETSVYFNNMHGDIPKPVTFIPSTVRN